MRCQKPCFKCQGIFQTLIHRIFHVYVLKSWESNQSGRKWCTRRNISHPFHQRHCLPIIALNSHIRAGHTRWSKPRAFWRLSAYIGTSARGFLCQYLLQNRAQFGSFLLPRKEPGARQNLISQHLFHYLWNGIIGADFIGYSKPKGGIVGLWNDACLRLYHSFLVLTIWIIAGNAFSSEGWLMGAKVALPNFHT